MDRDVLEHGGAEERWGPVAQTLTRSVAEALGDGCVCRMLLDDGRLEIVAGAHRDECGRAAIDAARAAGPALVEGWMEQTLARSLPVALLGEPALELIAPVDRAIASAVAVPVRRDGVAIGVVVAFRDAKGHAYTLRDQRRITRMVQEAFDPGEAAQPPAFVESERLLDHVGSGVWVTDRDGLTTYVNDAMCRLVGLPASALGGRPMSDFVDDEPDSDADGGSERRDHRLHRPDGADAWVSASSTRMTDAEGRATGTVTTMTDVTRRKAAEVELRMRLAAHEAVAELASWAIEGEPVATLVHGAAVATADLLGVEHTAVVQMSKDGHELIPRAVVGWDPELIASRQAVPPDAPVLDALGDREPFVVRDLDERDWAPEGVDEQGLRSAVYMDIGEGRGYIVAHSRDRHGFAGRDLSFLIPLAEVLARRWRDQPHDLMPVPA